MIIKRLKCPLAGVEFLLAMLSALTLLLLPNSYSATRTISNAGGNWNNINTWVELAIPDSLDDVVATSSSGNLTVNVDSKCKTLVLTNYTSTLTFNADLKVKGNITFPASMVVNADSKARTVWVASTANINSGGITLPCALKIGGSSFNVTLSNNWRVLGIITLGTGTEVVQLLGSFTLRGDSSIVLGGTSSYIILSTSTILQFGGTGSWINNSSGYLSGGTIIINTTGTITLGTTYPVRIMSTSLVHTNGTVITTGSTFRLEGNSGNSIKLNVKGILWNDLIDANTTASRTVDLDDTLNVSGKMIFNTTSGTQTYNDFIVNCAGGDSVASPSFSGAIGGSTVMRVTGGIMRMAAGATGTFRLPLVIAGNVAFSGVFNLGRSTAGSLNFSSGSPTFSSATLVVKSVAGEAYRFIVDTPASIGRLALEDSVILEGTKTLTVTDLISATGGLEHKIAPGQNIVITDSLVLKGSEGNYVKLMSTSPGSLAQLSHTGVYQEVQYVNVADIDSRQGRRVLYPCGSVTKIRTYNWGNPTMSQNWISNGWVRPGWQYNFYGGLNER